MFSPFYGEFLMHPAAVEYSGNNCTNGCGYCFANIRKNNLKSNLSAALSFLYDSPNGGTLGKELIKAGYPICLSNRTDPLIPINAQETFIFMDICKNLGVPIFWQTKGCEGEIQETFIEKVKEGKHYVYITITTPDAEISKRIEPNAPLPEARIQLAKRLIKNGIGVCVAINPCVSEWISDKQMFDMLKRLADIGVENFIIQRLHFSKKEIETFSAERVRRIGLSDLHAAGYGDAEKFRIRNLIDELRAEKFDISCYGMPFATNLYDNIRRRLGRIFFSNYDFYNWIIKNKKNGEECTFSEYYDVMTGHSDLIKISERPFKALDKYALKLNPRLWASSVFAQNPKSYKDVLKLFWDNPNTKFSPVKNLLFKNSDFANGKIIYTKA